MIAIVDYGVGNLFSLSSSLDYIGQSGVITWEAEVIHAADRIILPGVGAYGDAAAKLRGTGLDKIVIREAQAGKPLLGICLGMQLLLESSLEFGEHKGLGLIPGCVRPIREVIGEDLKVPHIGWNRLIYPEDREVSRLYRYTPQGSHVYFVHSFHGTGCYKYTGALTEYGAPLTASVENTGAGLKIYGTQFHPEKSGNIGLDILRAFSEI